MSTHDIVIVGHGAAGLAAAIAARSEASRLALDARVLVLERSAVDQCGGNTRWSPAYMRMASPRDVAPNFADDLIAASSGRIDREYLRVLAASAPQTIAWAEELGVGFHRPVYYLAEGPPRIQPVGGGSALVQTLADAARAHGVQIRYGCKAEALTRDAEAAVTGLSVRVNDGVHEDLRADAIVLASGGFAGNAQMLREHFGEHAATMRLISPGTRFNTGDGIRMAVAIGARSAGDWQGMHAEPVDARSSSSAPVVLVYPYGIVVDRVGQRFFDEGAGLVHETWETFAQHIQLALPGQRAFAILDSKLFAIAGYERAIRSELPPLQADSIEALAALAGIDAGGLRATVDAYNRAATGDVSRFDATRLDGLHASATLVPKKSNWARPIDQPPYVAYPLVGAIAYTFGGVATNAHAEVLQADGPPSAGVAREQRAADRARSDADHATIDARTRARPIPGLFAAGEITGHFYGLAPNAVAVLRALVFGRIAGINAARYLANRSTRR